MKFNHNKHDVEQFAYGLITIVGKMIDMIDKQV